jgi:hypothetical protein
MARVNGGGDGHTHLLFSEMYGTAHITTSPGATQVPLKAAIDGASDGSFLAVLPVPVTKLVQRPEDRFPPFAAPFRLSSHGLLPTGSRSTVGFR